MRTVASLPADCHPPRLVVELAVEEPVRVRFDAEGAGELARLLDWLQSEAAASTIDELPAQIGEVLELVQRPLRGGRYAGMSIARLVPSEVSYLRSAADRFLDEPRRTGVLSYIWSALPRCPSCRDARGLYLLTKRRAWWCAACEQSGPLEELRPRLVGEVEASLRRRRGGA